jgi:hypothetical protein
LELSLGHSLLVSLEDESRWVLDEELIPKQPVPDYSALFHLDAIKRVKPTAVTIVE